MNGEKLTKRQQQVLDYVQSESAKNSYPPTVREIGEALGLSSSATVHTHLAALEAKGYLHRDASKSRSLTVVSPESTVLTTKDEDALESLRRNTISLPLVGRVAAGAPILAEQNIEDILTLPKEIVGDSSSFLLRVHGDSMVDIGILDGDYVVVREQRTALNGDIVVAMIEDEATVKTFYKEKDCIRLQPQNETMEPIYSRDVVILGKVVALFRTI
ncbi:MAG: transcriptional repressor LexA [Actinobacteria bacterium]|nr:transcriptional repressor LexA [Actinomycetota bacterium]